jgi:hypothetical protein
MAHDFRPVFEALAERLKEIPEIRGVYREMLPFDRVPSQPALLALEGSAGPDWRGDGPPWGAATAELTLYTRVKASDRAPGNEVLALLAQIHDALRWRHDEPPPTDGYSTTLGGLVSYARLAGPADAWNHPVQLDQMITELVVEIGLPPVE